MRGKKAREIRQATERSKLAMMCFEGLSEKIDNHEKRLNIHLEALTVIVRRLELDSEMIIDLETQIKALRPLKCTVKKGWQIWK